MGKLVNMARTRDRAYFSPRAPSSPSATTPAALEMVTSRRSDATFTVDADRADDEDVERLPPGEVNKRVAAIRERLSGSASSGANR